MRCEEVRENVADYLANASRDPLESQIGEHLEHCSSCRDELEELRTMWAELGQNTVPRLEASKARAAILAAVAHDSPIGNRLRNRRFDMKLALKAAAVIAPDGTLF